VDVTQKTMTVHCKQCAHQWEVIMPMPISRAVKVMKGAVQAGCPNCRAFGDTVLVGPARTARPLSPEME
jgi:hypothetical protein